MQNLSHILCSQILVQCDNQQWYKWSGTCSKCKKDHPDKYTETKGLIKDEVVCLNKEQLLEAVNKKLESQKKEMSGIRNQIEFNDENQHIWKEKQENFKKFIDDSITQAKINNGNVFYGVKQVTQELLHQYKIEICKFKLTRCDIQWKQNCETIENQQQKLKEQEQQIVQLKEQINQTTEEMDKYPELIKAQEQKLQQLQQEKVDLERKIQPMDDNNEINQQEQLQQELNFYDIEINCDSILSLTAGDGWEIKYNKQKLDKIKEFKKVQTVSFYGLYNRGKSFLASKLSNRQLPKGFSTSTVGLSVIYPEVSKEENQFVFLDTAGTETPIDLNKEIQDMEKNIDPYEYKLKDRLLTEYLLQRFIFDFSNILIFIVDQLIKEEQRMIQKIKNSLGKKRCSNLVVVHNFSKLRKISDVEKFIQSDILESFDVEAQTILLTHGQRQLSGTIYIEKPYKIQHMVIAQDLSEAGNQYNEFSYIKLQQFMNSQTSQREFNVVESLIQLLKVNLPGIIEADSANIKVEVTEPKEAQQQLEDAQNNDKVIQRLIVTPKSNKLKNISFGLLGDLYVTKSGLNPKYYQFLKKDEQNKSFYVLQIEMPGKVKLPTEKQNDDQYKEHSVLKCNNTGNQLYERHGFVYNTQKIFVTGYKEEPENRKDLQSNCEYGLFKVEFDVKVDEALLCEDPPEMICDLGLLQLKYQVEDNEVPQF